METVEKNLTKAFDEFIGRAESTEEDRLRMCKQIIDNFFGTSSDYFKGLKDVFVHIVSRRCYPM